MFNPSNHEAEAGSWWRTLLNPILGRQGHEDLTEFQTGLVYRKNSRTAQAT